MISKEINVFFIQQVCIKLIKIDSKRHLQLGVGIAGYLTIWYNHDAWLTGNDNITIQRLR